MSDEIRSRPATKEYRDGWERIFGGPDFQGYAAALKAYGAQEVQRSEAEFKREAQRLRALYRIPEPNP